MTPEPPKSAAPVRVAVRLLAHARDLPLPAKATAGAAGLDLHAAVPVRLAPGARMAVPTGIAIALPSGTEGQVRARSGLARKHGLAVVNGVGTIDSDYRGEVMVLLINLGAEAVQLERGARIAQLIVAPVLEAILEERDPLPPSARGSDGFGSTGR